MDSTQNAGEKKDAVIDKEILIEISKVKLESLMNNTLELRNNFRPETSSFNYWDGYHRALQKLFYGILIDK